MAAAKLDESFSQELAAKVIGSGHAQATHRLVGLSGHGDCIECVDVRRRLAREISAGGREQFTAGQARQQRRAQARFEAHDRAADGRFGKPRPSRCRRHRAGSNDVNENAELVEIHGCEGSRNATSPVHNDAFLQLHTCASLSS